MRRFVLLFAATALIGSAVTPGAVASGPTTSQAKRAVKREIKNEMNPGESTVACSRLKGKTWKCTFEVRDGLIGEAWCGRVHGKARATKHKHGWDVKLSDIRSTDCV